MATVLIKSTRAREVWRQFADAWGPEVLLNAYEWSAPPKETRQLETFYEFYDDNAFVGWGSLTKHPLSNEHFLSLGLFPETSGKHYYRPLKSALVEAAFSVGADRVTSVIMDSNPEAQNNALSRPAAGKSDGWKYAGQVWYPVGYKIFTVTREACPGCKYVLEYCKCCGGQGFIHDGCTTQ